MEIAENVLGIPTCVAVIALAYFVGIVVKNVEAINDKWIPVICGAVGAPLGVLAWRVVPDFPASDCMTAVAVGIMSGLTATGINQIIKQFCKND